MWASVDDFIWAFLAAAPRFLEKWQTLIAGILAIAGAYATLAAVTRQINANEKQEAERRRAEETAWRAVLPLTLALINQHANGCMLALRRMLSTNVPVERMNLARDLPELGQNLIEPLRNAIRYSLPPQTSELAALLSWLQIHEARLHQARTFGYDEQFGGAVYNEPLHRALADAAQLRARSDALFEYGRGIARNGPAFDLAMAQSALYSNEIMQDHFPRAYAILVQESTVVDPDEGSVDAEVF